MTDKELKRLSRTELLELLLLQTKETERLTKKLEMAERMLSDRQLKVDKSGDLAHAVLEINGVMEAAQAAAQQYLDDLIRMEQETRQRCEAMLLEAQKKAGTVLKKEPAPAKSAVPEPDFLGEIYALLDDQKQ